jgi:hypothetical protein
VSVESDADQAIEFTCPTCRARQSLQPICRRCGSDLALYMKATLSLHRAKQLQHQHRESSDEVELEKVNTYIKWLKPGA